MELHEDFIKVVEKVEDQKLKILKKIIFLLRILDGENIAKAWFNRWHRNADQILKEKFGDKIIIKTFEKQKGFIARKLSSSTQDPIEKLANIIEEKSMWQKFGL